MHPIAILAEELNACGIKFEMNHNRGYELRLPTIANWKYCITQDRPHSEYYRIYDRSGELPVENGLLDTDEVIERYWQLKEKEK